MNLTSDQQNADEVLLRALRTGQDVIKVDGLAGTGKSTWADTIASRHGLTVAQVAPTGKAALRLTSGRTIHSVFLQPREWHCSSCPRKTNREDDCHGFNDQCPENSCKKWFEERNDPPDGIDLIICDEASMVSEWLHTKITKHGIPVLYVGDSFQLPPIGSESFNALDSPDARLTEITRQAQDSPIVKFAHIIRNEGFSLVKVPKGVRRVGVNNFVWNEQTQLICFKNKTRVALNSVIRQTIGLPPEPTVGDKVVCLRNDRGQSVVNGSVGTITDLGKPGKGTVLATIDVGKDQPYIHRILLDQFGSETPHQHTRLAIGLWDYAYVLTCHKAQGSEFDSVAVWSECSDARWWYTAVTRAKRDLAIVS